jgi:hypothetical protein
MSERMNTIFVSASELRLAIHGGEREGPLLVVEEQLVSLRASRSLLAEASRPHLLRASANPFDGEPPPLRLPLLPSRGGFAEEGEEDADDVPREKRSLTSAETEDVERRESHRGTARLFLGPEGTSSSAGENPSGEPAPDAMSFLCVELAERLPRGARRFVSTGEE